MSNYHHRLTENLLKICVPHFLEVVALLSESVARGVSTVTLADKYNLDPSSLEILDSLCGLEKVGLIQEAAGLAHRGTWLRDGLKDFPLEKTEDEATDSDDHE